MTSSAHRVITTEWTSDEHGTTYGTDEVPADGDIDHVQSVARAAEHARAVHDALNETIKNLEPQLGWKQMDGLLSGVNAVEQAVRREAVARLIAAAADTYDFPISVFVVPEADEDGEDAS